MRAMKISIGKRLGQTVLCRIVKFSSVTLYELATDARESVVLFRVSKIGSQSKDLHVS